MSIFKSLARGRGRAVAFIAVLALGGMAARAAAGAVPTTAPTASHQTVVDVAGRRVSVPVHPRRILLGESRLLMAVALLEGAHPLANIVGWQGDLDARDPQTFDVYAKRFPSIRQIPLIGKATEHSVSSEKALSLKPDLAIFTFGGEGPGRYNALVQQLEEAGTAVVFVDFRQHPMRNTLPSMRLLGEVLGRQAEADAYIRFYTEHLAHIKDTIRDVPPVQRPTVFVDLLAGAWGACCHTAGHGSFGEFVEAAGGRNIAADLLPGALGDISMEQLIVAQPDVYVVTGSWMRPGAPSLHVGALTSARDARQSLAALISRPGYGALKAIRDGRAYGIWHNYYDSPYNIIAIEALAKWFYPERFRTLDVQATHDELYRRFLSVPPDGTYWVDRAESATAPGKGR
ncbi:Ferrisiderophore receptor Irp6A [Apophysomyces sp. BC1015]|nr:Ferrisiderophore receptor Irp6A [Apophysomyces sp. BC1015]